MSSTMPAWFRLPLVAAVVAAVALTVQAPPATASVAPVNTNPAYVHLYSANMENLAGYCRSGEWTELIDYMDLRGGTSPDIFVVEQINKSQLATLVQYMSANLRGTYQGRMAKTPLERVNSAPCTAKRYQGNAIIWRTGRFESVRAKAWTSLAYANGACRVSGQDRTVNQVIRFRDKANGKYLSVASVHWPTMKSGGWPCAKANMARAHSVVSSTGYGGALRIIAGDTNIHDRNDSGALRPWYAASRSLNYTDAIYAMCSRTQPSRIRGCLNDNWTLGKSRYDYVFARRSNGTKARIMQAHTITFVEANAADGENPTTPRYSEHRAVRAHIHYP